MEDEAGHVEAPHDHDAEEMLDDDDLAVLDDERC